MAKGIKKIEWTGEGSIISNLSERNRKARIKADQFVYFKITEWHEGTTDEQKKGSVLWHLQTHNPRGSILKLTKRADDKYGVMLPKKLCGPFTYYVQAILPYAKHSKSAGVLIGGWCEPKIISSAWAKQSKGEDVRKTNQFNYGEPLYLNLSTEGLNGAINLIIEIHRRVMGGDSVTDDQLIKVYTKTPVNNGEVNIILTDTLSWQPKLMRRKYIEEFYIKVKDPLTNTYIKDDYNDVYHARYLRIQDRINFVFPERDLGLSKSMIGELKQYERNAGTCKFTRIGVNYRGDDDLIFDEGKFIRKINPKDNFSTVEQIHYDYDKWDIRNDAKPILDKVADYLILPPLLPVELGAHTDNRGTEEYNLDLSAKRADSVVKYLISKGVPSYLITGKGYGKAKLIHKETTVSEAQHQENRRITLQFKIFDNNAETLVHDVVVPSYKKPTQLRINIEGFIRKGCHKKKEHLNTIQSHDSYKQAVTYDLTENQSNYIDVQLNSRLPTVPHITDVFNFGNNYRNIYSYHLNSCTYYSGTKHPSFAINAYPDIVWVGHFLYNYNIREGMDEKPKTPYFFHGKTVELKNGITEEVKELTDSIIGFLLNFFPGGWVGVNVILPYLESQAEYYDVGLHAYYDRDIEKRDELLSLQGCTTLDFIKADATTRRIVALVIYQIVVIGLLIDLIMIFLTRGGSASSKVVKIASKVKKGTDYLDKIGAEIVPPSIAVNTGVYYKMQADSRMALIYEANIKAEPLVAINFTKKYTIKSLLDSNETDPNKKKSNEAIDGILSKIGKDDVTFSLTMEGEIALQQNIQYNVLTEQYTLKDKFNNLPQKNIICHSKKIRGSISLEGAIEKKYFKFSPLKTDISTNVKLEMFCEAFVVTEFGFDKKDGRGLFMTQKLKFSGLKGTFKGEATVTSKKFGSYKYSSIDDKSIDFKVLEGFEQILKTIYFFNTTTI
ncbi:OmpA family protein [Flavobacterium branchiarum]|uniref:OmpA family protein n=1 Tax=Flavobacterium branchiarum TaxID=1114870 RepID=A0ABV5FS94_9FLAO|nr:OmpA family protein [Flavobacterium branchiarum]MDN3673504.1 OmpA family protein [Flavobacterium branchiarum]